MPEEKQPAPKSAKGSGAIAALLDEDRAYPPKPEFTKQANVPDDSIYAEAEKDPEKF